MSKIALWIKHPEWGYGEVVSGIPVHEGMHLVRWNKLNRTGYFSATQLIRRHTSW